MSAAAGSVGGTTAAALLALPLTLFATRPVAPAAWLYHPVRGVLDTLRGVDGFVFALIFVAAVGLGPFAGVLGVALHSAGSIAKRLGMEEGTQLPRPIVEYSYKNDELGDPMVSEEYVIAFGWATQQDLDDIVSLALRVNDFLSGVFYGVGIKLIDFKIEIGRIWDGDFMRLVVADEISPDSCRLWDVKTGQKLDKDVFRRDLGSLTDAYTEVARRLGVMPAAAPVKPTLIN